MDYFPKTEMSHLLPANSSSTSINYTPDFYSAYADSFDLSLLSSDDRETSILSSSTSTNSEINKYQSLSPSSIGSASSSDAQRDYIPTTIFNNNNDQTVTFNNNNNNTNQIIPIIKTEKLWNCDSTTTNQLQNQKNSTLIDNNNYNINSPPNYNSNHQQNFCQEDYTNANTAAASLLFQQLQKHYQFYPSPLPSPPQYEFCNLNSVSSSNNYSIYSPASSTLSPSPCPSLDQQLNNFGGSTNCLNNNNNNNNNNTNNLTNFPQVKQEYLILPPSPPESNGSPSPSLNEIKSEPGDNDIETNFIDINILLERTLQNFEENQKKQQQEEQQQNTNTNNFVTPAVPQDHQLLREYLQDTTFQKKHNLKPLALESLIGGLGVRGDIEPVISLALEHAKRDAQATCAQLQISPDPQQWTATQVHAWIRSTIEQFKLQEINELELKFSEDGINLLCLSEEEFIRRVPESGATIHAQLEIWKLACCENFQMDMFPAGPSTSTTTNNNNNNNNNAKNNWSTNDFNMDFTDDEDDDMEHQTSITALNPTTTPTTTPTNNENGQLTTSTTTTATINNNNNNNTTGTVSPLTIGQQQQQINPTTGTTSPTLSTTTASTNNTNAQQTTPTATPTPTTTTKAPRTGGSHIHLWQFLKELLATPQVHGTAIRWLDRNKGVFKIEDSVRVAKLWGRRKNRPAMNYDKLSRSIRQYYKKGIMKKTERSQRLVYQFCHPYSL